MHVPAAADLLDQISGLPAGRRLRDRLGDMPGVFLVGGAVRDLLLGGRPLDLDLVVEGDLAAVAHRLGGERIVYDRFGTSTVTADGYSYDLARARSETYPRAGALPEVRAAGLDEDLRRRDFTVNAMAIALGGPRAGQLVAAPHALDDLDRRALRVLHAESFRDDPTRLIRLVRYWSRLDFGIEPETHRLAAEAIGGGALATVSLARVGNELRLLAREPDPVGALDCAQALGLDRAIHPGFGLTDPAPARRALDLLPADGRPDRLVLAAAAAGLASAELAALLDQMEFEAADREVIVAAAGRASDLAEALEAARRPSEIAQAVEGAPEELVALAGALGPDATAQEWFQTLRTVRLDIDGRDLLAAGVPEGPAVGEGLHAALRAKLDGRISGPEQELAIALEAARATG